MHKNQEIKPKKHVHKEKHSQTHKSNQHVQKFHYETSQSNYNININSEKPKQEHHVKNEHKQKTKPQKKIRYITQQVQKSQWIQPPRQHSNKKSTTLKVSTLNNIEDLNVYQKCKSSKKLRKGSFQDEKQEKIRLNAKVGHQNTKIKLREVKSQSKSVKRLTLKSFVSHQKDKPKSKKSPKPKSGREHKGKPEEESPISPSLLQIENSYYFSNYPENVTSPMSDEVQDKKKGNETVLFSKKRQQMFLFESRDASWVQPSKKSNNLQSTVELLN